MSGIGHARPLWPASDCCKAAPSVLEFDSDGKLLRAWGGPSEPGFIGGKCKREAGCIWPTSEHGIYVDQNDNVWIAGNSAVPGRRSGRSGTPWATNEDGGDGFVLKFDRDGNFKMRIGGTPKAPDSDNTIGGINGTPLLFQPADMVVDSATNRLYIADGYGNRRVLIVDAETGKYIGHFGAYGNSPVDDRAAQAAAPWLPAYLKGNRKPAFFRSPVHCVKIAKDGKLYLSFSTDKAQSCLYVGDNANMTIYILNRVNLRELGTLGHSGRMAGEFHYAHQLSVDSKGNIYTGEVDTAKRTQKFLRYGAAGCSGTGSSTVGGVIDAR